jgi:hypothetical protein
MSSSNSPLGRERSKEYNGSEIPSFFSPRIVGRCSMQHISQRAENGLLKPATSPVPHRGVTSLMNSSVKELRIELVPSVTRLE